MWLEYELLSKPEIPGFFCISTSYRQEPNIIEGRHDTIFPMFEFEFPGTIRELELMERELVNHLGLWGSIQAKNYDEWCKDFGVSELTHDEEAQMVNPSMIKNFPNYTSPFWNMKQNGDGTAAKIDVILGGMETIGSAERSTNVDEMQDMFHTISHGEYAQLLFKQFGEQRVIDELDEYLLSYDFFPRFGGGIGLTRMARALKMNAKQEAVLV